MDDLISRQAAIDAFLTELTKRERKNLLHTWSTVEVKYFITDMMEQMPSAQPEPCDDPRADVYYLAEKIGIHRLYALVVELRGEPDPCEDAVSRKDVVKFLDDWMSALEANCHHQSMADLKIIKNDFENLPSAQPERKKGKWIYNSPVTMKCNQCGLVIKDWDWHRFKCCPNCGANMKGEQDD